MAQVKSDNHAYFSEKSEKLAAHLCVNLDELPARLGISKDMFYAYRTGRYPISKKAWRKLEQAEIAAELPPAALAVESTPTKEPEADRLAAIDAKLAAIDAKLTAIDAQYQQKLAALDARRAALDAEFIAMPGVADALAAGLTLDVIRALTRAEIERRRAKGELPPAPDLAAMQADIERAHAKLKKSASPGQKHRPA